VDFTGDPDQSRSRRRSGRGPGTSGWNYPRAEWDQGPDSLLERRGQDVGLCPDGYASWRGRCSCIHQSGIPQCIR